MLVLFRCTPSGSLDDSGEGEEEGRLKKSKTFMIVIQILKCRVLAVNQVL